MNLGEPLLRVLSLGAGVQSTAVLLMARDGVFGDRPDVAIFADTGWEPPAVYAHLEWLEREVGPEIPIRRVSAGNLRDDVLASKAGRRVASIPAFVPSRYESGVTAALKRGCTTEYKIRPITQEIRTVLGVRPRGRVRGWVEQWFGISADEVQRVRENRVPWIKNHYPLVARRMTRADCLRWLAGQGYPPPPRSACIGCPYHSNAEWRTLRDERPAEWADACAFDRELRHGLKGVQQPVYLHRSLVPLDEADLNDDDPNQLAFSWAEECEGMCGV